MTHSPRPTLTSLKLAAAMALGLSATLACVAASSVPDAHSAEVQPLTTPAGTAPTADALSADGGPPDGGCPHGALEDPHRGFVRCLDPGEKSPFAPEGPDAGPPDAAPGAPGSPGDAPPPGDSGPPGPPGNTAPAPTASATPTAAPTAPPPPPAPPKPGPPPLVEMKTPKFENGNAPRVEKNLSSKKVLDSIAKCVADAGGLTGKNPTLKVEFLVRARGKAEGVEVTPTGVSTEAAKCVQTLLKNRSVGVPDADPVGVTVVYSLKPASK